MAPCNRDHPDDCTNNQFPYHSSVYNPPCFPQTPRIPLHGRTAYNADMGTQPGAELDAWLREDEVVVASSDRAARALQAEFHRRRRTEGRSAWHAPKIVDWKTFVRTAWEERNLAGRLLLNPAQELALWSEIVHSEQHLPTALTASVRRLASMAREAPRVARFYCP